MTERVEQTNQLTRAAGKAALPVMEKLVEKLPKINSAVLCTADGLNLCALEVDEVIVGKLSSLGSTLFSIGSSVIDTVLPDDELSANHHKEVIITIDNIQVMVIEVEHSGLGNLILLVSVKDTATGVILMTLRHIAKRLKKKLASFEQ